MYDDLRSVYITHFFVQQRSGSSDFVMMSSPNWLWLNLGSEHFTSFTLRKACFVHRHFISSAGNSTRDEMDIIVWPKTLTVRAVFHIVWKQFVLTSKEALKRGKFAIETFQNFPGPLYDIRGYATRPKISWPVRLCSFVSSTKRSYFCSEERTGFQ